VNAHLLRLEWCHQTPGRASLATLRLPSACNREPAPIARSGARVQRTERRRLRRRARAISGDRSGLGSVARGGVTEWGTSVMGRFGSPEAPPSDAAVPAPDSGGTSAARRLRAPHRPDLSWPPQAPWPTHAENSGRRAKSRARGGRIRTRRSRCATDPSPAIPAPSSPTSSGPPNTPELGEQPASAPASTADAAAIRTLTDLRGHRLRPARRAGVGSCQNLRRRTG
jgi:hypothetical protein